MNLSTITKTALGIGGQAASLGLRLAQGGVDRIRSLRGGRDADGDARVAVVPAPAETTYSQPGANAPDKPKADPPPKSADSGRFVREVSNPKRARKLRQRAGTGAAKGAAAAAPVEGAEGHGGRPAGVQAENTPSERAASGKGRQAAPMGSSDPEGEQSRGRGPARP